MMICTLDMSVPADSQCAKCCIYCTEEDCEYRCLNAIKYKTEDEIASHCTMAYE